MYITQITILIYKNAKLAYLTAIQVFNILCKFTLMIVSIIISFILDFELYVINKFINLQHYCSVSKRFSTSLELALIAFLTLEGLLWIQAKILTQLILTNLYSIQKDRYILKNHNHWYPNYEISSNIHNSNFINNTNKQYEYSSKCNDKQLDFLSSNLH